MEEILIRRIIFLAALCALAAWGAIHLLGQRTPLSPGNAEETVSIYTTGQATTPQMPLWKALADGDLAFTPEVHYWKNLNDLRGLLLAGKGDVWVGAVDVFAQAARRGAPVRLVCVTGWKKFHILSARDDVRRAEDLLTLPPGAEVASTPPMSPGQAVLRALGDKGLPPFDYTPYDPKQLALHAARGDVDLLVAPEPLVSVLLAKAPALRVVANVEEMYGRMTGRPGVLPVAGIAVNTGLLEQRPDFADTLEKALLRQEPLLNADPEQGLESLPKPFGTFIPRDVVRASLSRDLIRVRPARECRDMILDYLDMVCRDGPATYGLPLPDSFFGGPR